MKKFILTLSTAITLASCATAPSHFFNRPNGTSAALLADIAACGKIASDVHARAQYVYSNPKYGTSGAAGAALGSGFAAGLEEGRLQGEAVDNCLISKGWTRIELTEAERTEFGKLPGGEPRKAYLTNWMASHPVATTTP